MANGFKLDEVLAEFKQPQETQATSEFDLDSVLNEFSAPPAQEAQVATASQPPEFELDSILGEFAPQAETQAPESEALRKLKETSAPPTDLLLKGASSSPPPATLTPAGEGVPPSLEQQPEPLAESALSPSIALPSAGAGLKSGGLAAANPVVRAARGALQLFFKPSQWAEELSDKVRVKIGKKPLGEGVLGALTRELGEPTAIEKTARADAEQNFKEALSVGGAPLGAASAIANGVVDTAVSILLMKAVTGQAPGEATRNVAQTSAAGASRLARWATAAKATARHAGRVAAFKYATTPGDQVERVKAGALAAAYVGTPALSTGVPGDYLAKAVDFALNTGITLSTGQYKEAWREAERLAEENGGKATDFMWQTMTPLMVSDMLFSAGTKSSTAKTTATQFKTELDSYFPKKDVGKLPETVKEASEIEVDAKTQKAIQEQDAKDFLLTPEAEKQAEALRGSAPEGDQSVLANAQKIGEEMFRRADIAKKQDIIANAQKIDAEFAIAKTKAVERTFKDVRAEAKKIGVDLSGPTKSRTELQFAIDDLKRRQALSSVDESIRESADEISNPSRLKGFSRSATDWMKRKFLPTKGLGKELDGLIKSWRHTVSSTATGARRARLSVEALRGEGVSDDVINSAINRQITADDLAREAGVESNSPIIKNLFDHLDTKRQQEIKIADELEKSGANPVLVEKIRNNTEYATRFYEAHLKGEAFKPEKEATIEATRIVRDQIEESAINAVRGVAKLQPSAINKVGSFLETRNEGDLQGLNATQKSVAHTLAKYGELYERIEIDGNTATAPLNMKALNEAATSVIKGVLDKTAGKKNADGSVFDVSGLHHRKLDQIFRSLYGEVKDPALRTARTDEIQKTAMANLAFFNRVAADGKGKWWSGLRSDERGLTTRIPEDPVKYGQLAGKWVNKGVADIVNPTQSKIDQMFAPYFKIKSIMRLTKLYGPRTIMRNYVTSLTGFAMGCGDALEKGYFKHLKDAHSMMKGIAKGDDKSLAQLEELQRLGVFNTQASSMLDDIRNLMKSTPKTKLTSAIEKAGIFYSYIDFPAKVASYQLKKSQGLSDADAAEHVRKFYQSADSLPEVVRDMSKLPLADYPGYFFDSARISANQIGNAMSKARQGDFKPLGGVLISKALATALPAVGAMTTAYLRQALGNAEIEEVSNEDQDRLRALLPDYYKHAPLTTWWERGKDGNKVLHYAVPGDALNAFPVDAMLWGAAQESDNPTEFIANSFENIKESRFTLGMFEKAMTKAYTGEAPGERFSTKGIHDVLGKEDPDKDRIINESLAWLPAEVVGGQLTPLLRQHQAVKRREARGDFIAGTYSPRRSIGDVWSAPFQPIRSYSIDKNQMDIQMGGELRRILEGVRSAKSNIARDLEPEHNQQFIKQSIKEAAGTVADMRKLTKDWYTDQEMLAIIFDVAGTTGLNEGEKAAIAGVTEGALRDFKPKPKRKFLEKVRKGQE